MALTYLCDLSFGIATSCRLFRILRKHAVNARRGCDNRKPPLTGFGGPRDEALRYVLIAASICFFHHFCVLASLQWRLQCASYSTCRTEEQPPSRPAIQSRLLSECIAGMWPDTRVA